MRKGILCSILMSLVCASWAAAQAPGYYPPPYPVPPMAYPQYPAMPYGYPPMSGPRVMVGQPLTANGPIQVPDLRQPHPMNHTTISFNGSGVPRQHSSAAKTTGQPLPASAVRQNAGVRQQQAPTPETAKKFQPVKSVIQRTLNTYIPQASNTLSLNQDQRFPPPPLELNDNLPPPDSAPPGTEPETVILPHYPSGGHPSAGSGHGDVYGEVPGEVIDQGLGYEPCWWPFCWDGHRPPHSPRGYKVYGSAEYLFWWVDRQRVPPLLLAGPAIIGDGNIPGDNGQRTGGRTTFGFWLNPAQTLGLEATGFMLGRRSASVPFVATPDLPLARPFVDANTGLLGTVPVTESQIDWRHHLWGAEANLRKELLRGCKCHLDLLGGVRYLRMEEDLRISDVSPIGGIATSRTDFFETDNEFYGGQIGLQGEVRYARLFFNVWGKCAFGIMQQRIGISGATNGGINQAAGLLAQPGNIGSYRDNRFAIIPEVGAKAGIALTNNLRVSGGYNLLYISNVARPGDQIDLLINPLGGGRPAFFHRDTDFWAHGLSAEVEFRY